MAVLLKDSLLQAEALSQQGMIRMEKGSHSIRKLKTDAASTVYG